MSVVFADSYYYLALLNRRDAGHAAAVDWARQPTGTILTTDWILNEVGDALAVSHMRRTFPAFVSALRSSPDVSIVAFSRGVLDRALALYELRADKEWSLTDCVSFIVMWDAGISDALTADRHFEQAGFVALLK
ncbi:MAG: type II toxin-antitoxin system VapC family toxin [Phycisphaerales bacterium]|nr:type II toxin-antitoxin system VapC family toxin [Phycisphaerales bacterium]